MAIDNDRRKFLKIAAASGSVGLAGCSSLSGDDGDSVEWTLATSTAEGSAGFIMGDTFKNEIEEMTDGRFSIDFSPGGQYGGEVEQLETVESGSIELVVNSLGLTLALRLESSVFGTVGPAWTFQEPVWDHQLAVWNEVSEEVGAIETLQSSGLNPVSRPVFSGSRHILSQSEIRVPSNAEGVSIRIPQVPGWAASFEALGFEPDPIAINEVYTALQTGTINALDVEPLVADSEGFVEVTSHYNLLDHYPNSSWFVSNVDAFEELSDDDKEIVRDAAESASTQTEDAVRERGEELLVEFQEEHGIEIIEDVDREAFLNQAEPAVRSYLSENGILSYDEIQSLAP